MLRANSSRRFGLDEDPVEGGTQQVRHRQHLGCQATERAAIGQRANEHIGVGRVELHTQPVAEQRTAGDRASGVDRQHADVVEFLH